MSGASHKRFIQAGGAENAMKLEWTIANMRLHKELEGVEFRLSRNVADGPRVYVLEGPERQRRIINQLVESFDKSEEQGNA